MYWPDTDTGVDTEPARKPVASAVRKYFTEGGAGVPPTVPGGDWFNAITNEVLNVLAAAGIDPSKTDDDQLLLAIQSISNAEGSYDALRRSYLEAGYLLRPRPESFETGGTLTSPNDVLISKATGKCYSGVGPFPQHVDPFTNPETINFSDKSYETLRMRSATGISLSHYLHLPTPLETALELHRQFGVELVIDCDCQYSFMLIKPNDSIRCVGWPTLTKKDNGAPTISASQAPERPDGYIDDFSINAFFVVYHEPSKSAERVRFSGGVRFFADSSIALEKYAEIPRLSFSHITDIRMDSQYLSGTLDGVHFKDEYANTIGDIHVLNAGMARYGFLWEDLYGGTYYSTGTSANIYGLHTVKFRKPFRQKRHQYSKLSVCGGEIVGVDGELTADLPLVFDIEDSVAVLDAPSAENLYGALFRVKRTASQYPASCVINAPQANTGIFGSKDNAACKLFDIDGGASCVVNGGFMTSAAAGYNLKFGGSKNDSLLQLNATDLTFILNSIKNDTEDYTGFHELRCMSSKYMMKLWGTTGNITLSGQIPFENVEYDPFGLRSGTGGSQATVRRTGFYSVKGSVRTNDAIGYLSIYINGSERARTYFDHVTAQTGEQWSTYVDFDGRINAGSTVELRITLTAGLLRGQSWYDNKFTVELK